MQTVCSRCFKSYDSREKDFYYDRSKKRYDLWCKQCDTKDRNKKSKRSRRQRKKRPLSADPVEDKFIRLRKTLVQRGKKYGSDTITTNQLLSIHLKGEGKCHYTGLEYAIGKRGPLRMSVDRVDNSVGYVLGNVVLCCWFVNCAKNEWSLEEMKRLWRYLPTV